MKSVVMNVNAVCRNCRKDGSGTFLSYLGHTYVDGVRREISYLSSNEWRDADGKVVLAPAKIVVGTNGLWEVNEAEVDGEVLTDDDGNAKLQLRFDGAAADAKIIELAEKGASADEIRTATSKAPVIIDFGAKPIIDRTDPSEPDGEAIDKAI